MYPDPFITTDNNDRCSHTIHDSDYCKWLNGVQYPKLFELFLGHVMLSIFVVTVKLGAE